jgi:hypothetical protein
MTQRVVKDGITQYPSKVYPQNFDDDWFCDNCKKMKNL